VKSSKLRWAALACLIVALSLVVAACGGGGSSSSSGSTDTAGSSEGEGEGGGTENASEEGGGETQDVSLQLDWTPNTNHTGFYVADKKGLYEKVGVNLNILPYSEGSADTLVGAGKADCGITFQENVPLAVAAGSKEKAVMAIVQHQVQSLITNGDSGLTSPKDLTGKTYGGFGLPFEIPFVNQMVKFDGGKGEMKNVILNTGAYEAVYHGQVDSSIAFRTWELIEAAEREIELNEFPLPEYGVPDTYNVMMACNTDWLESNPELAKKFVQATSEGFEDAVKDPKEAGEILIEMNPGAFANENLVFASAEMLAKEFYDDEEGKFGCMVPERWATFVKWEFEQGIIIGSDGNPVSTEPDPEEMWTSEYLPSWCGKS
jgi:ABC-type nitrate/sulfonate/bicarbonate transport system substrate-binding protein